LRTHIILKYSRGVFLLFHNLLAASSRLDSIHWSILSLCAAAVSNPPSTSRSRSCVLQPRLLSYPAVGIVTYRLVPLPFVAASSRYPTVTDVYLTALGPGDIIDARSPRPFFKNRSTGNSAVPSGPNVVSISGVQYCTKSLGRGPPAHWPAV
jgi:hypothetical protein